MKVKQVANCFRMESRKNPLQFYIEKISRKITLAIMVVTSVINGLWIK